MKISLVFATVAISAFAVHADTAWFNGGMAASYPSAGTLSGGSWGGITSASSAAWDSEKSAVVMDIDEDETNRFTATSSAPSHHSTITYSITLAPSAAYTTLPTIPADAKIGVVAYERNSEVVYAFIKKDTTASPAVNTWHDSGIVISDLNALTAITITVSTTDGQNVIASYKIGTNSAIELPIMGVPEFQYVEFMGAGLCSALSATQSLKSAVATVESKDYYYIGEALDEAGSTKNVVLCADVSATIAAGASYRIQHENHTFDATATDGYALTRADGGEGVTIVASTAKTDKTPGGTTDGKITGTDVYVTKEFTDKNPGADFSKTEPEANGLTMKQTYLVGLPDASTPLKATVGKTSDGDVKVSFAGLKIPAGSSAQFALAKDGTAGSLSSNPEATIDKTTDATGKYVMKAKVGDDWIDSCVTVGVQKVESTAATTYVAVQWKDVDSGENISPTNVVDTSNLTADDTLDIFNPSTGDFDSYALQSDKTWTFVPKAGGSSTPTITSLARGMAIKLTRNDPSDDLYTIGKYEGGSVETEITTGKFNLIANPSGEAFSNFDKIGQSNQAMVIPTGEVLPTATYRYIGGKKNKWYKIAPGGTATEADSIPAGQGFFLNATDTTKASIEW